MAEKSKLLAYFLWLVGGVIGLHHFYLGRDMQGFLYWCTLGGYFGCGWIRDLFCMNEYLAEANNDQEYQRRLKYTIQTNKKPPFSTYRFVGMIIVSYLWATVFMLAIPQDKVAGYYWNWLQIFVPIACALGVWSVGNIGHNQGGILWPLIAAYACYPLKYYFDESTSLTLMVLASAWAFDSLEKKWRPRTAKNKSIIKRLAVIGICIALYSSLWGSYLYFNCSITDSEGEEIPIREAVHHFFSSPWWLDVKQSLMEVWNYGQQHGWYEAWKQIIELADPNGEQNAFKVLELYAGASQGEINTRCKRLSVKYHPDRVRNESEKKVFQERFYEVQQACELLSNSRLKKSRKNKKLSA